MELTESPAGKDWKKLAEPALWVALWCLLGAACALFRWRTLESVEIGGDALKVWEFARQLAHGNALPREFNHHTARFGLVIPTMLTQKIWGSEATTYFIGPIIASTVIHLCCFEMAWTLGGRRVGLIAGMVAFAALWLSPELTRPSSQILPEIFGPMYTVVAFRLALATARARADGARSAISYALLICTGVAVFFAYGAKVSYLYFAPAVALLVGYGGGEGRPIPALARWPRLFRWIERLGRPDLPFMAGLTAMVIGWIGIETLAYRLFTRHSGQMGIVDETHGVSHTARIKTAVDFFRIYHEAPDYLQFAIGIGTISCVVLLFFWRRGGRPIRALSVGVLVYLFLFTFILRKWNPPIPWTRPQPRYLLALIPPFAVLLGLTVALPIRAFAQRWLVRWARLQLLIPVFAALASSALLFSELQKAPQIFASASAWSRTARLYRDFSAAFREGTPIVSTTYPAKPLRAVGGLYVDPSLMVRNGVLLSHTSFLRNPKKGKGYRYIAKAVEEANAGGRSLKRADKEMISRIRSRKCGVFLSQRGRYFSKYAPNSKNCTPLADWISPADSKEEGAQP